MTDDERLIVEPRRNSELIGQDAAEATVLRAWTSGRMHHAWLISGPRGVGKATLAYRIARMVLAGAGGEDLFGGVAPTLQIGPDSPIFRQVASGGHPDLLTIERGFDEKRERRRTEILVEDVRQIGEFLHLKAARGGWRVVIVDSADEMNRNAANALLKILEEPPRHALILMVSHSPSRLLATIRSRCRRLTLNQLPESLVLELLARHQPNLPQADQVLLARLAHGSIGLAVEFEAAGGIELCREIGEQLAAMPRTDATGILALADRVAQGGGDGPFRLATELLLENITRSVRAGAVGPPVEGSVAGGAGDLGRLIGPANLDQWLELWEKISRLFARTEAVNLDRKQVWIGAMLEIGGLARR
ncbi:MAG: DNA polymerase III subunit delta' [Dongiaceae bacterium]